MTEQPSFTDRAADAAGALDLVLTDAALGPLRRMLPGMSGARFVAGLARRPRTLAVRGTDLLREYAHIATGQSAVSPEKGDRRFTDPAWTGNPVLRRLVQAYLATAQTTESLVADAELSWRDEERMRFRFCCAAASGSASRRSSRSSTPSIRRSRSSASTFPVSAARRRVRCRMATRATPTSPHRWSGSLATVR